MNVVFNCVTPFATTLIAEQYYFAIQVRTMCGNTYEYISMSTIVYMYL
jgi:hypothetical protein